jgi:hypothetical protein
LWFVFAAAVVDILLVVMIFVDVVLVVVMAVVVVIGDTVLNASQSFLRIRSQTSTLQTKPQ